MTKDEPTLTIGERETPYGRMWLVVDYAGKNHWFSTRDLATKWAARYRYNHMIGETE